MFTYLIGDKDYTEAEAIELFNQEGFNGEQAMPVYEAFAPGSTPREKLAYALTDTMFRNSTVRILDAVADSGGACWSWMCTWENDQMNLRATHAIELSFLWNWIASVPLMAGNNPPRDLGPAMRAYWTNFARTGSPFADGEPDWPTYNIKDRPVLLLDAKRRVENNLDDGVRKFWFQEDI
jgi:para-nitrobenzyl esterase